jgi:hypothetical protein
MMEQSLPDIPLDVEWVELYKECPFKDEFFKLYKNQMKLEFIDVYMRNEIYYQEKIKNLLQLCQDLYQENQELKKNLKK